MCETLEDILAPLRAEMDRAESLVCAALAMPSPRLALVKDDRALLLCRSTYGRAYRITDLDQYGPSGHRDYAASDTRGMAQEIYSALCNGYQVRS